MVLSIYFLTYASVDLSKLDATKLELKRFNTADDVELAVEGGGVKLGDGRVPVPRRIARDDAGPGALQLGRLPPAASN